MPDFNDKGEKVSIILHPRLFDRGRYKWTATFEAVRVVPGKSYIRLTAGDKVLKETAVRVD